jgi:thioredoxin 1
MLKEITNQNFEEVVMKSDKPVIVDFWAEWCSPCRIISPILDELSKEYEQEVKMVKCDVDENPELCRKFNIKNIPAVLFIKNGEVLDTKIGASSKANFVRKIELLLMHESTIR